MTPESTYRPASRVHRRSVRLIAGLALVFATAACGSGGDDVAPVGSAHAPSSAMTASPEVTEVFPESTTVQNGGIAGPYMLRIRRIGVRARVVPIQGNEEGILEPPRDPRVVGWWSDGAAPGNREDRRYWSDTASATKAAAFSTTSAI